MVDKSKRQLFSKKFFLREVGKAIAAFESGVREAEEKADFDKFFDSYESSYALTLAYPDDILLETARREGIATDGREKIDIVKELFQKKGGYGKHRS
jgi:hypothetical protein